MSTQGIALVTHPTRLQGLRQRWGTLGQAKFLLANAHAREAAQRGGDARVVRQRAAAKSQTENPQQTDFEEYQREDAIYQRVVEQLETELQLGLPIKRVDRSFIANFDFGMCAVVVVVGQDGLVANTAKYVGALPIVAVNPDRERIDGVLLPFQVAQARQAVRRVLDQKYKQRPITLAEVNLNDGQRMLAFNDFFIGASSHVSARYLLESQGRSEPQSSSGVIVSTGAGSSGWLSSVFNMTGGVAKFVGSTTKPRPQLKWEERRLIWAVREPFVSRRSQASLVAGWVDEGQELVIESLMPDGGVIFSDGIEQDFLPFASGAIARVTVSQQRAHLVTG